jgi:GMP synthase-like glutamine amidotransferase
MDFMHLAVLMTNTDESDFAQAHPKDGQKFQAMIHTVRPDWQVTVFSVKDGVFPAENARFDGWIIGGSPASVHDPEVWIERLFGLIRRLVAEGQPVFGACFGHQAVAMALGGVVGRNPGGWVFGLTETVMEGQTCRLYAAHVEQVLSLPPRAQALGGNADCAVGSYAIGERVLCTQYHPEMTHEFATALVQEYAPKLPADVAAQAEASLDQRADSPWIAERIARFFEAAQS